MKVSELVAKLQKMPQDLDFCYAFHPETREPGYQYRTPQNPIIVVEDMGTYGKRVAIKERQAGDPP